MNVPCMKVPAQFECEKYFHFSSIPSWLTIYYKMLVAVNTVFRVFTKQQVEHLFSSKLKSLEETEIILFNLYKCDEPTFL